MTTVALVRHAESEFGAQQRTAGASDPDLSPRGRAQAQALGDRLRSASVVAVVSSPLMRARRTAEAIAAPHGLPVEDDSALRELHQGELEGLSYAELGARYRDVLAAFRRDPATTRLPGGEMLGEVQFRARAALARHLARVDSGMLVVVTHNFVLGALVTAALDAPLSLYQRLRFDPAGVTLIDYRPTGPTLVTLNSTDHLDGRSSWGDILS